MRRLLAVVALLAVLLASPPVAAGLFGGGPPARIPIPARVYRAEVEDRGGTVLRITKASFDGEVFLFGTIGEAQVTVPFDRFTVALFADGPDDEHRTVTITDTSGETVRLVVEADRPLYGHTPFGNYKIEAGDIRRLTVLGED